MYQPVHVTMQSQDPERYCWVDNVCHRVAVFHGDATSRAAVVPGQVWLSLYGGTGRLWAVTRGRCSQLLLYADSATRVCLPQCLS